MIIRLAVRLFIAGEIASEESLEVAEEDLESVIPAAATRHAERVAGRPFMVEFEFLDMPEADRFLRFGTDPRGMIKPIPIPLTGGNA